MRWVDGDTSIYTITYKNRSYYPPIIRGGIRATMHPKQVYATSCWKGDNGDHSSPTTREIKHSHHAGSDLTVGTKQIISNIIIAIIQSNYHKTHIANDRATYLHKGKGALHHIAGARSIRPNHRSRWKRICWRYLT
jgi:hypothetical protein